MLVLLIILTFAIISQPKIQATKTGHQPVKTSESITLLATGDILMHNTVIAAGFDKGKYQYDTMFYPIKSIVESADYAMINLEAALAGPEKGYTGYPLFNAPDSLAEALKNTGFDLVTNANNHILDRGLAGAMRTLDVLRQNGLDTIGINKSQQEKDTLLIKEIRGIKVGFLAYGYDTNGIPLPQDKPYFYNLLDEQNILKDIGAMRPQVDILVLSLHWGVEYSPYPTEKQVELAHRFFAQGADVIIGGHPHVLQPAEVVTIKGKKKFVVYSMGNSLGDQNGVERNSGVIISLTFKKDLLTGSTELQTFDYTPTFSNSYMENGRECFRIIPLPETIRSIKANQDPYLKADSLPLLEEIVKECQGKMGNAKI
jgi:poly-gamma-glutamate synthesis protein (capsule biosynthesis protein)